MTDILVLRCVISQITCRPTYNLKRPKKSDHQSREDFIVISVYGSWSLFKCFWYLGSTTYLPNHWHQPYSKNISLDNWYNQTCDNIQMRQARSQRKERMTEWLGEAGEGMRDRWVDGGGGGGGGQGVVYEENWRHESNDSLCTLLEWPAGCRDVRFWAPTSEHLCTTCKRQNCTFHPFITALTEGQSQVV